MSFITNATPLIVCFIMTVCVFKDTWAWTACTDVEKDCTSYEEGFCSSEKYGQWAKMNCKKTCGFCDCQHGDNVHPHGQTYHERCDICTCVNSLVGCSPKTCRTFDLPDAACQWVPMKNSCCFVPQCPSGVSITYPGWWDAYVKFVEKRD